MLYFNKKKKISNFQSNVVFPTDGWSGIQTGHSGGRRATRPQDGNNNKEFTLYAGRLDRRQVTECHMTHLWILMTGLCSCVCRLILNVFLQRRGGWISGHQTPAADGKKRQILPQKRGEEEGQEEAQEPFCWRRSVRNVDKHKNKNKKSYDDIWIIATNGITSFCSHLYV